MKSNSACVPSLLLANSTIINQVGQCASIAQTTFNQLAYTTTTSQSYALTSGTTNSFTLSTFGNTGCTGTATATVPLTTSCTLAFEQLAQTTGAGVAGTTVQAVNLYQQTTAVTSVGTQVAGSGNGAGLIL